MKISEWIKINAKKLRLNGICEPEKEAKLVLSYLLEISPGELDNLVIGEKDLSESIQHRAEYIIHRRRTTRKPLAYILKKWEFYGLMLEIDENVLIPRPETEILVDKVLQQLPDERLIGADVGTGSGAIAIALLMHRKNWRIIGTDISLSALKIANRNSQKYKLQDRFHPVCANLFDTLSEIDFLVANLPYIASEQLYNLDQSKLQREIGYEPKIALDGGDIGIDFIREAIHKIAGRKIKLVGLEFGIGQKEKIQSIIQKYRLNCEFIDDYSHISRIALIKE